MATRNIEMPRSIAAGAYRPGPAWGGVGGLPRSGAQLGIDLGARQALDAENEQIMGGIARSEARNNPMQRAIEARAQDLAYERLQPWGAESSIEAEYAGGGGNVDSPVLGEREMGGYTIGEGRAIEQDRDKQRFGHALDVDIEYAKAGAKEHARYKDTDDLIDAQAEQDLQELRSREDYQAATPEARAQAERLLMGEVADQKQWVRKLGLTGSWPAAGGQTGPMDPYAETKKE